MPNSTIVRFIRVGAGWLSRWAPGIAARWLERLFLTPRNRPTPAREVAWLGSAWRQELPVHDTRVALYSWGSGPTVLLAHGWAGRAGQLGALAAPLVRRGCRVVAYDAPAHGASAGARTNLVEMARVLAAVAAHVGPVEAVVAHSLGTAACTVALSDGLDTRRVVFVAPPAEPGAYLAQMGRFLGFSEAVVERTRTRIQVKIGRPFSELNTAAVAPRMDLPLLVIHDGEDRLVPVDEGRRVTEAWPGARLQVTEGLGHERILRDEQCVRSIVDFVAADTVEPMERTA